MLCYVVYFFFILTVLKLLLEKLASSRRSVCQGASLKTAREKINKKGGREESSSRRAGGSCSVKFHWSFIDVTLYTKKSHFNCDDNDYLN